MDDERADTYDKEEGPFFKPFSYINKDLDFLILLIYLEANSERTHLLNFGDFFKGNYWDHDDIRDELSDTNDYYSIEDMVMEQVRFIFEDLRLGRLIEVGIDNTTQALEDVLVKVASIGSKRAKEDAPNFMSVIEQIIFLEKQEHDRRVKEADNDPENFQEVMKFGDKSVFFTREDGYFRAMQMVAIELPHHIQMRVEYDENRVAEVEKEVVSYLEKFSEDEFITLLPRYQKKRLYFSQQIENFYRYINRLNFIGCTVNIPFTILNERGFEAVKIIEYLQLKKIAEIRWSDEGSWKLDFKKIPTSTQDLIGESSVLNTDKKLKTKVRFDSSSGILYIHGQKVTFRKTKKPYELLNFLFTKAENIGKSLYYDEIVTFWGTDEGYTNKNFYDDCSYIKRKIATKTGLNDFIDVSNTQIEINSKYLT